MRMDLTMLLWVPIYLLRHMFIWVRLMELIRLKPQCYLIFRGIRNLDFLFQMPEM